MNSGRSQGRKGFNVRLGKLGEAINYPALLPKERRKKQISGRLGQEEKIEKENTAREI